MDEKVISLYGMDSYSKRFHEIETLAELDLFVRVDTYDVNIPIVNNIPAEVDIFEEMVLRLLECNEYYDESVIAEKLCLDSSLIGFILMRLIEKQLIDAKHKLTDAGKLCIKKTQQRETELTGSFLNAHVFAIKGTRDFLPYIHLGTIEGERVIDEGKNNLVIGIGSTGTAKNIPGIFINERYNKNTVQPKRADIIRVIKNYNKLCSAAKGFQEISFDEKNAIKYTNTTDTIIHCKAVLQNGNADYMIVSEGFVFGSEKLAEYINSKTFVKSRIEKNAVNFSKTEKKKTDKSIRYKYNNLYVVMKKSSDEGTNVDELHEARDNNRRNLKNLFTAVEWTLKYHLDENPIPNWIFDLLDGSDKAEINYIEDMAKKIGLRFNDRSRFLISMLTSRGLRNFKEGKDPAFYTLFPLAIAAAANNPDDSFNTLVKEIPNIAGLLEELNNQGGRLRHEADYVPKVNYDVLREHVEKFIKILLPDYNVEAEEKIDNKKHASQRRINAKVCLSEKLGVERFNTLDETLQNELISISPDKSKEELPPDIEVIGTMSRIVEYILRRQINKEKSKKYENKAQILRYIRDTYEQALPNGVREVNYKYILKALNKQKSTINGYLVAYMYMADPGTVKHIMADGVLEAIGRIGNLRAHLSNVGLVVTDKEMNTLRERLFLLIRKWDE